MSRYFITELAASDLVEIRDYIARDNPVAAKRIVVRIKTAIQMVARNPEIGHVRTQFHREVKLWLVKPYIIVYQSETPIMIVRVLHGSRDLNNLL